MESAKCLAEWVKHSFRTPSKVTDLCMCAGRHKAQIVLFPGMGPSGMACTAWFLFQDQTSRAWSYCSPWQSHYPPGVITLHALPRCGGRGGGNNCLQWTVYLGIVKSSLLEWWLTNQPWWSQERTSGGNVEDPYLKSCLSIAAWFDL